MWQQTDHSLRPRPFLITWILREINHNQISENPCSPKAIRVIRVLFSWRTNAMLWDSRLPGRQVGFRGNVATTSVFDAKCFRNDAGCVRIVATIMKMHGKSRLPLIFADNKAKSLRWAGAHPFNAEIHSSKCWSTNDSHNS